MKKSIHVRKKVTHTTHDGEKYVQVHSVGADGPQWVKTGRREDSIQEDETHDRNMEDDV